MKINNWREILENIELPKDDRGWANPDDFLSIFNLDWDIDYGKFSLRVKQVWPISWICTDTQVGLSVYFLDGEPVAVSSQYGRKCGVTIEFISQEAAEKLHKAMLEMYAENKNKYNIVDLDEKIDEIYERYYADAQYYRHGL